MVPYQEQQAQPGTSASLELERQKLELEKERLKLQQMQQQSETDKVRLELERVRLGHATTPAGGAGHALGAAVPGGIGGGVGTVAAGNATALLQQVQLASVGIETKLTEINAKVEQLLEHASKKQGRRMSGAGMGMGMQRMFGGDDPFGGDVLVQTVQRLVEEHSEMSGAVVDKSTEVEEMQQKVTDLLEKNQDFVRTNNQLLEKRNDAMVEVGEQRDQLKSAILEKDKIDSAVARMTAELQESQRLYNEAQLALRASGTELEALRARGEAKQAELEQALREQEVELARAREQLAQSATSAADELAEQRAQRAAAEEQVASLRAKQQESAFEAMGAEVRVFYVSCCALSVNLLFFVPPCIVINVTWAGSHPISVARLRVFLCAGRAPRSRACHSPAGNQGRGGEGSCRRSGGGGGSQGRS